MELRKKFNVPGRHPGCSKCHNLGTENCRCKQNITPLADSKVAEPGETDFKDVNIEHPISSKTEANSAYIDAVTARILAELYK